MGWRVAKGEGCEWGAGYEKERVGREGGWSLNHKSRTSALVGVSCTQKPALVFNSSCCSFLALMSSAKIALFSSALIALGSRYTEPAVSLFDKMTQPIPLL